MTLERIRRSRTFREDGVQDARIPRKWWISGDEERLCSILHPCARIPLTFDANYERGINSIDARGVVQQPEQSGLATTDFYQFGTSSNFGRFGISTDVFLIIERAGLHS